MCTGISSWEVVITTRDDNEQAEEEVTHMTCIREELASNLIRVTSFPY
jgi:hypothetical protein